MTRGREVGTKGHRATWKTDDLARSTPAHLRIADELRRRIVSDVYEGELLPPELRLAEEFGVSRPTIRVALQHLVNDGLIDRQPGSGTRIVRDGRSAYWALGSLTELTGEFRLDEVVTLFARPTSAADHPVPAGILHIPPEGTLYHLYRILSKDGFAYGFSNLFCHPDLETNVPRDELGKSFFLDLMLRYSKRQATRVRQSTAAILPSAEAQETLRIGPDLPVMRIRRTYFAQAEPLIHVELTCRGDRFEQVVNLVTGSHPGRRR